MEMIYDIQYSAALQATQRQKDASFDKPKKGVPLTKRETKADGLKTAGYRYAHPYPRNKTVYRLSNASAAKIRLIAAHCLRVSRS